MLEVSHLSKHYGPFKAVNDVSFTAKAGEVVGFLGPNGAGKTTTMRLITGYLPLSAGEVKVEGLTVRTNALEAKRRIGYLPEMPPVYPELTVDEYLNFVARLWRMKGAARKEAVTRACAKTALTDVRHRVIAHLSKGYRQRVGIAQAILHDPPLLILDEPTAGLDPRQILETRQLIRELAGNHTVIVSTHILSEAAASCDRVVIIHKGELVAVDTPDNLTHRLKRTDTVLLQVRGPAEAVGQALRKVEGVLKVTPLPPTPHNPAGNWQVEAANAATREAIAQQVVSNGWGLVEMRPMDMSLEEIFLSLTAGNGAPGAGTPALGAAPPAAALPAGDAKALPSGQSEEQA